MSSYLGCMVWFTVHKTTEPVRLALEQAHSIFTELGLDTEFLPEALLPVHAFQAASAATTSNYIDEITGEEVDLYVREIARDRERHVRHVIRRAVNRKNRLSSSAMLIELGFYHTGRTSTGRRPGNPEIKHRIVNKLVERDTNGKAMRTYLTSDQDVRMAEDWLKRFHTECALLQTHLSADALRTVVRDYLLSLNALLVNTRGGVYFVPNEHSETVQALGKFIERISPECALHITWVVNTADQRAMLRRLWEDATSECLERINKDIAAAKLRINKSGRVSIPTYATLQDRWDTMIAKIHQYADLTGAPTATVQGLIDPTAAEILALQHLTRPPR